jgi:geranylgeranyl diphosphate synthase, type II
MLIKAKELATGDTESELDKWLNRSDDPFAKIETITSIYNLLEVRKLAEIEMEEYVKKAIRALDLIAVDRSKKELLRGFADQLLIREY